MGPAAWIIFGWLYLIALAAGWTAAGMIWLCWQLIRLPFPGARALVKIIKEKISEHVPASAS